MGPPTIVDSNNFANDGETMNVTSDFDTQYLATTSSIPVPLVYDAMGQPFMEEPYLIQPLGTMQLESRPTLEIAASSNPYDDMSIDELKADLEQLLERVKITSTTGPEWDQIRVWLAIVLLELGIVVVQQVPVVSTHCYDVPLPSYYHEVPMLQAS
ncbi:hypothetical protein EST38_g9836 [Candolleomyces aberdarensis]|uniref:Uncharacterized protein n=1 Tax=Candolleomyces aberdarensis TaxID=2316362 RepID=A0A4Q2DC73_9AGAR|nr:hypothetical protein EST38_g9836 [Candolleomyces aberdarensis]